MENNPELKTSEYLKGIVLNLPESPGIYQYLNTEGVIIYVGKAKNLKRRVSSYFNKEHEPGKTRVLVSKIADIRYIVVNSEEDALLLENNLIKKYKPRYNVLLKDDKTYPSICVQNEYFPRIFKTRKIIRNGSSYYGPYSHVPSMNALLDLIKHLYPLRTCNLNLSPENIRAGKIQCFLWTARSHFLFMHFPVRNKNLKAKSPPKAKALDRAFRHAYPLLCGNAVTESDLIL